ncbi:glycosyltransferase [Candidatus Planktophila dulcis]|uniref:glycosyltransferase family 4 protein n=1 Tax=Candidatus Planktophila dulcis TaxID=1884914 RepID=UPI000BAC58E4|nr:glycosyltransferase family 4 protein [Candidatus Planktophila dulcis]ASY20718.1 glycosyltransferase [Candidatus Planktophila dulcis]
MKRKISLFSGIYAPETGGPAKFAQTFSEFATRQDQCIEVFAYSRLPIFAKLNSCAEIFLLSNENSILKRFLQMTWCILKSAKSNNSILVNGSFWEVAIARHLMNFKYVAKVPGDIVWERARNLGKTTKNIDNFQNEPLGLSYKILRYFFAFSLRKAEWVIVPSEHLGELCKSWGVQKSRIVLINNSVFLPTKPDFSSEEKKFDFVTVCRLVPWKGVDEIIINVSELGVKLLVIGDGPERDSLQKLSDSLNANVTFVGEIPPEDVPQYLKDCSTFVLNSNFEATSYALIEAQANGLLTIANESTGSEQVITHNLTGLLCGVKSGINLNQAMRIGLYKDENSKEMRVAARLSVERSFNLEINYRKIMDLCIK